MSPDAGRRLGVLGWPVAHSRSPAMHNAALAALGLEDWRYQLLPVPPALLAETVAALPATGFRFFAVPPAIAGGTSFAVRGFGFVE